MQNSDLFIDPAIVSLSHAPAGRPPLAQKKSTLEPGSALSKLLDSAMANAAKELTPESSERPVLDLESAPSAVSGGASSLNNDWMLTLIPECKRGREMVYSIQTLILLQNEPAVSLFDSGKLPPATFWQVKQKSASDANRNNAGNLKRNRRNNNNNGGGNGGQTHDSGRSWDHSGSKLSWDRRPGGFLKQTELESMSRDKISQLLGENPNEDTPEWDTPVSNVGLNGIDMGSTVEDFERWKQLMRQEDRRKNGVSDEAPVYSKGNDVDNFFSFVGTSTDNVPRSNVGAAQEPSKALVKDSSKFSSFFGAPGRPPHSTEDTAAALQPRKESKSGSVSSAPGRGLRFFKNEPATSSPVAQQSQQVSQLPPNISGPAASHSSNQGPPQYPRYPSDLAPPGIAAHSSVPPQGYPGLTRTTSSGVAPPPGLSGPPAISDDNFFSGLLLRRQQELPGPASSQSLEISGADPKIDHQQYPPMGGFHNIPSGAGPNHPFFGRPPPGMFPPGMPPQGPHGHPQQPIGSAHPPNSNMNARMGGPAQSGAPGTPGKGQMQLQQQLQGHQQSVATGNEIPPWMRMQPGPNGQLPPPPHYAMGPGGFPPMNHGFLPGMAPSNAEHRQK